MVPGLAILGIFRLELYIPIVVVAFMIPFFLYLLCGTSKMELTKDKANNILTIQEHNFCRCKKKRYNSPLNTSVLKAKYNDYLSCLGKVYDYCNIFLLNVDPKVKDIDNNNIKKIPYKFITKFENYIGEEKDLETIISSFLGNKFQNNIEEEINLYSPPEPNQFNFYSSPKTNIFVKISDHFYMFYNYYYLRKNDSKESFKRLDWLYTNNLIEF